MNADNLLLALQLELVYCHQIEYTTTTICRINKNAVTCKRHAKLIHNLVFSQGSSGSSNIAATPTTPRNTFSGSSLTASAVALKGAISQRPSVMTSPAAAAAGAALAAGGPYRNATSWTPQGYAPAAAAAAAAVAQQAYRYTAPLPQPAYAAYTPHTATTPSTTTVSIGRSEYTYIKHRKRMCSDPPNILYISMHVYM